MAKSLVISVPTEDYKFIRSALDTLAGDIITDAEAGQRGAKRSVMVRMLAHCYIRNVPETTALMLEIKALASPSRDENERQIKVSFRRPSTDTEAEALAAFMQMSPGKRLQVLVESKRFGDILAGRLKPWELDEFE